MKFVTCISGLALSILMLQGSSNTTSTLMSDEEFTTKSENVDIKKSVNYEIGDLDLIVNKDNTCYSSPFRVKLIRTARSPKAGITVSYVDNTGNLIYLLRNHDISRSYSSRFKTFSTNINIPFSGLAAESTVSISFNYATKHDVTSFSFKLSNPSALIVGDDKPKRVYSRFSKPYALTHGINYYNNVMVVPKNDYACHEFYYDHFDIYESFAIKSSIQYAVKNVSLVFDNKNLDCFNQCAHRVNGISPNYSYFDLLPVQRKLDYFIDLKVDGEFYFDPTTNKMFSNQEPGLEKSLNNFYMPKGNYEMFKAFEFYLVFDFDVTDIIYRLAFKNKIIFDDNTFSDGLLVTKTDEKTVDDNFGDF